ncbi:MAG: hypothetical protein JSR78_14070 [Proteobacteria bacterium]|nr:hypothetical protein [Pseudomonadota bacterium]
MKIKTIFRSALFGFAVAFACAIGSQHAQALCAILSASVTPLSVSTGTYSPPNAPTPQSVTITVSGTFLATLGDLAGGCAIAVAFNRSSLPASMALASGGAASMPYALQSASSGGNSLLYTGGGLPAQSNSLLLNFPASTLSVANFSVTGTVWALAQPVDPQQAGSYLDSLTVRVFSSTLAGLLQGQISSQTFTVTGQVAKSCTIGGLFYPSIDTATIPVTAGGQVVTAAINKSYANALCNTPSNLQLTSQNGAVTTASAVAGLQNFIDYSVSASFAGASASLDTASNPGTGAQESSSPVSTSGSTPSGTLSVAIVPQLNSQRLVAGAYADTLTITITPQ